MSIPVSKEKLGEALGGFGAGYLLTVSPQGRVKAVTVEPRMDDSRLLIDAASRGTAANLESNPAVTMIFPPREPKGFSLIVDGTGRVDDSGIEVDPETAVLHRPAAHADGPPPPDGCGHDCHPVR